MGGKRHQAAARDRRFAPVGGIRGLTARGATFRTSGWKRGQLPASSHSLPSGSVSGGGSDSSRRRVMISFTSSFGRWPSGTTMPSSSGSSGSSVASWESSRLLGMKWSSAGWRAAAAMTSSAAGEVDEDHAGRPQPVAVGALQRRAGDDAGCARTQMCSWIQAAILSSHGQRSSSVSGLAGRHLGDVGRGVEVVTLLQVPAEAAGEQAGDRRLAGAGHAHDDQDDRRSAVDGMR